MSKLSRVIFAAAFAGGMSASLVAGEYDPPEDVELVNLATKDAGSAIESFMDYSGYPAKNMFDGNTGGESATRWLAYRRESDAPTAYFIYQFNTPTVVNAYRIWVSGSYRGREPFVWKLLGSNDNVTWDELDDVSLPQANNWGSDTSRYFTTDKSAAYSYYKFACTKQGNDANYMQIQEFQMFYVPTLRLGDCELLRGEDGFEVAAQMKVGTASELVAVATKDADPSTAMEFVLGRDVTAGVTVTNKIGALAANKTYVVDVVARDATESVKMSGLGIFYAGSLVVEKIRDADEGSTLPAIVRVSRASAAPYDLNFTYSLSSETAVAGRSYVQPSGAATIAAGAASVDLELVPMLDSTVKGDQIVTFTLNTRACTLVAADQKCDVTISECSYDISTRYVDAAVIGGGQRAGTDWEDAYSSIVDAVTSVNQAGVPATIYVKPGTYETTAQLKLNGAIKIIGWTGVASDVVITNRTAYSSETDSKDNRVIHMNDAVAGVYNVTLGGGGCSRNGSGGSSVYIGANGGVASNCVVSCTRSGSYHNVGAVWMDGEDALVTHTIVRDIEKYNVVDPNWGANKWALGIHAKKGRVENCLVVNARSTCTKTTNAANNSAGGIYAASGVKVVNCTFVDCHGTECGGIYADAGAEIINCVVADSKPWQVIEGVYTKENNVPVAGDADAFVNCATDGDVAINDTCVIGSANTFFTAYSDGNLIPKSGGRLKDAGTTPTGWAKGDGRLDLAGLPRFVGTAVDIGAYELQSAPQPKGTVIIYR